MATYSGMLIRQLTNPGFSQGLFQAGTAMGQRFGGVGQARDEAAKRNMNVTRSIQSVLQQMDPRDPKAVASVQAMAEAGRIPPAEVQKWVNQAQENARQEERMEMARQSAKIQQRNAQWQAEQKAQEDRREKYLARVQAAVDSGRDFETVAKAIPDEADKAWARQAYNKTLQSASEIRKLKEEKAPVPEDILTTLKQEGGQAGEAAVKAYNASKGQIGERAAKENLMRVWGTYQQASIYANLREETKATVTTKDLEFAEQAVEDADSGGLFDFGIDPGKNKTALIYAVAQAAKTDLRALTPEGVKSILDQIEKKGEPAARNEQVPQTERQLQEELSDAWNNPAKLAELLKKVDES